MQLRELLKSFSDKTQFAVKLRILDDKGLDDIYVTNIKECLGLHICHIEKKDNVILITVLQRKPEKALDKEKLPIKTVSMIDLD